MATLRRGSGPLIPMSEEADRLPSLSDKYPRDEPIPPDGLSVEMPDANEPATMSALPERTEDDLSVELQEDGSAIVNMLEPEESSRQEFGDNMAGHIDEGALSRITLRVIENIEQDKKDREDRDKQYAEGIKRTGLGNEAPGGANFAGASRAVHPVLVEACIDFAARAMKELFPSKGPVKTHIIGKQTDAKLAKAERKKTYMNWQLTKQISEYRSELEQLLTQLPLGGSQYKKFWRDDQKGRIVCEFVPIDDILLPFACSDFYGAQRVTHVQHLTQFTFEGRVRSGLYRDLKLAPAVGLPAEETQSEIASNKVEGRQENSFNVDGVRDVYEVQVTLDLQGEDEFVSGDSGYAPYILTIDKNSARALALYRNWSEKDERREKLHFFVEYAFFPWRGAYAIGLGQAAGSLAGASTGALRALLDSAHAANVPTALKLKGARLSGQTVQVNPFEITELEGPANVDDIRKLAMPLPFPGPSAVLFELLKFCVDAAKGLIKTADDRIAENNANMPVGTTLALIEQGSITFSAVHSRLHDSQRRALEIVHRLDGEYLSDEEVVEELGELVTSRSDFQGPMDVQPVSDPNIFSDSQRYAQQQAVLAMRQQFPGAFKDNVLIQRTLKLMNYPDPEEVMNVPAEAEMLDPVDENLAARDPLRQIKVFEEDDDITHLQIHVPFLTSPVFCANPVMANPAMPKLIAHCAEHIIALYAKHMRAALKSAEIIQLASDSEVPGDTNASAGARMAEQELVSVLQRFLGPLTQAAESVKQLVPPPKSEAMQLAEINAQAQVGREQAKQQGEQNKINLEAQVDQTLLGIQQKFDVVMAKHEEEVGARNVAIAEESERRAQQVTLAVAKLREESALQRQLEAQQWELFMSGVENTHEKFMATLDAKLQQLAQPKESSGG